MYDVIVNNVPVLFLMCFYIRFILFTSLLKCEFFNLLLISESILDINLFNCFLILIEMFNNLVFIVFDFFFVFVLIFLNIVFNFGQSVFILSSLSVILILFESVFTGKYLFLNEFIWLLIINQSPMFGVSEVVTVEYVILSLELFDLFSGLFFIIIIF